MLCRSASLTVISIRNYILIKGFLKQIGNLLTTFNVHIFRRNIYKLQEKFIYKEFGWQIG